LTNEEIHIALFTQPWQRCTLRLVNGDAIVVEHPEYLFMPPARNWVLWVKPNKSGVQFIPTTHIVAIDLILPTDCPVLPPSLPCHRGHSRLV
jgi:hypothetical protein